jgi:ubiquinone/menaquinone biosynthesis C-methylase UbiE
MTGLGDKDEAKKFWSEYAKKYNHTLYKDVTGYPSLVIRHNYILDMFDKAGGRVLDIGCGPGKMLVDLMSRQCEVSGIDIAAGMLEIAQANIQAVYPDKKVDIHLGDAEKLDYPPETFDAVICAGVIEYLQNDEKWIQEVFRVLKRGGTLIVSTRNALCLPRFIDSLNDMIKKRRWGLRILTSIKALVQGKKNAEIKYTHYRKHILSSLNKKLQRAGLIKEDYRFFHFYPFFVPFDKLLPSLFIRQGLKMERLTKTGWGWLASGYIVKARKV